MPEAAIGSSHGIGAAAPLRHSQMPGGVVGPSTVKASAALSGAQLRSATMPAGKPVTTGRSLTGAADAQHRITTIILDRRQHCLIGRQRPGFHVAAF